MKNLLIVTILLSVLATVSALASEYEDVYNEGYEEGYETARKKSDGLDIASIVGGFVLGYGFHEIFISKRDD